MLYIILQTSLSISAEKGLSGQYILLWGHPTWIHYTQELLIAWYAVCLLSYMQVFCVVPARKDSAPRSVSIAHTQIPLTLHFVCCCRYAVSIFSSRSQLKGETSNGLMFYATIVGANQAIFSFQGLPMCSIS